MKKRDVIYMSLSVITVILLVAATIMLFDYENEYKYETSKSCIRINRWSSDRVVHCSSETVYSNLNIFDTVAAFPDFALFLEAVNKSGFIQMLEGEDPLTVFVPVNSAFQRYDSTRTNTGKYIHADDNIKTLMENHIIRGVIPVENLVNTCNIFAISGKGLMVNNRKGLTYVENSIILRSFRCENGMIHVIDTLLISNETHK
jgi:uncharacterized surface protein with fasciclin (FAS1) repeats